MYRYGDLRMNRWMISILHLVSNMEISQLNLIASKRVCQKYVSLHTVSDTLIQKMKNVGKMKKSWEEEKNQTEMMKDNLPLSNTTHTHNTQRESEWTWDEIKRKSCHLNQMTDSSPHMHSTAVQQVGVCVCVVVCVRMANIQSKCHYQKPDFWYFMVFRYAIMIDRFGSPGTVFNAIWLPSHFGLHTQSMRMVSFYATAGWFSAILSPKGIISEIYRHFSE